MELVSNRTESEEVYLPVSVKARLQASLRVEEGSGTFSIVESGRGFALKVNFSDHVVISAKVESTEDLGGLNFTLLNRTDEREREVEYWISYQPHDPSDYFCRFSLVMDYEEWHWRVSHSVYGFLDRGWNTYKGEIIR